MQHHITPGRPPENSTAGVVRTIGVSLLLLAALVCSSGCSMVERLNTWMVENGIVRESLDRQAYRIGIDTERVVEVRTGTDRGVGVVVEEGLVLTSAHILQGAREAKVLQHSLVAGGVAMRTPAKVIWTDDHNDLCLLAPDTRADAGTTCSPQPGEAWLITLAASGQSRSGSTSRSAGVQRITILPGDRFEMDGTLQHGDSGSPLIQNGHVVGVVRTATRFARVDPVVAALRDRANSALMVASVSR